MLDESNAAIELYDDSNEAEFLTESFNTATALEVEVAQAEFQTKMSGEHDDKDVILEINGGSGGTEAQDWAQMLFRMYVRYTERNGFKVDIMDVRQGEEAGIKSATLLISGRYAYGYLKGEQGVHRLVRISPFDSNARRHTSFASIAVTPDVEEEIDIVIDEKDLRVDTYRSSGSGGQHVNKTDSAIRLTHIPTNLVVACQTERSQHKNRALAMKLLKSKLYDLQAREQAEKIDAIKGEKRKIDFGSQIRSYVMHPYQMVKDHRTGCETSGVNDVLDGGIGIFLESYLVSEFNR